MVAALYDAAEAEHPSAKAAAELFRLTILENKYIPVSDLRPSPKQARFLSYFGRECLFGGAAGGGKSDALLMAALQFVHVPGYRSLLVRRTHKQLASDDGLIRRLRDWLRPHPEVKWSEKHGRFTFPSGATISAAYLDSEKDKDNFQGPGWHCICVDELTQFKEDQYRYLFSRLRVETGIVIPDRVRTTSNPGRLGHEWVKARFVNPAKATKYFIASRLDDNPGLNKDRYRQSLAELDPITRRQLEEGDWEAYQGGRFRQEWFRQFKLVRDNRGDLRFVLQRGEPRGILVSDCYTFLSVDLAASVLESADYTVIVVVCVTPQRDILILDAFRDRIDVHRLVPTIAEYSQRYHPRYVAIEDAGFQSAILAGCKQHPDVAAVRHMRHKGRDKLVRATPAINRASAGQIYFPTPGIDAPWVEDFQAELVQFTGDEKLDAHDDCVDALAYAVQSMEEQGLATGMAVIGDDATAFKFQDRFGQPAVTHEPDDDEDGDEVESGVIEADYRGGFSGGRY